MRNTVDKNSSVAWQSPALIYSCRPSGEIRVEIVIHDEIIVDIILRVKHVTSGPQRFSKMLLTIIFTNDMIVKITFITYG